MNWATKECYENFNEELENVFLEAARGNDEDDARSEFCATARALVEECVDVDLRDNGIESNMIALANDIDDIDYDELFDSCLEDHPDFFEEESEDDDESSSPSLS